MEIPVYLASRNPHKCHEIEAMGRNTGVTSPLSGLKILPCTSLNPEMRWQEEGQTYLDNARIKVAAIRPWTRERVIADDSGLEVEALGGAPGVISSSFGGVEGDHARNLQTLLERLQGVPPERRRAAFVCLIVYSDLQGQEWIFQGRLEGSIAEKPRGHGGFGYDPLFIPQGMEKSLAELNDGEKNALSHRGRAFKLWKNHLALELRRQ